MAALVSFASAEILPIKLYTTSDGLAHNHINRIRQDSLGYLWFCTDEGLSRFDGYQFVNYTPAHGLPHRTVNDLLEARDGTYWAATDGGVCRFDPAGVPASRNDTHMAHQPLFVTYRLSERTEANHVNTLAEDQNGAIWCASSAGFFRLEHTGAEVQIQPVEIGLRSDLEQGAHVSTVLVDSQGVVWAGAISGLYVRWPDGRAERFTRDDGLPDNFVQTLLAERDGSIWGGTRKGGFCRLTNNPAHGRRIVEQCYSAKNGLAGNDVRQIFCASDGTLWLATVGGLSKMAEPGHFASYTASNGLSSAEIYKLGEDREGNLWIGTKGNGVMRMAHPGFVTYGESDGFHPGHFVSAFAGPSGEVCVVNRTMKEQRISFQHFDGLRFAVTKPFLPEKVTVQVNKSVDLRKPPLRAVLSTVASPAEIYRTSLGDLWFNLFDFGLPKLQHFDRATRKLVPHSALPIPPAQQEHEIFCEDGAGNLWIGFSSAGVLARYRRGVFTYFGIAEGLPKGRLNALQLDQHHRLWIATSEGGLGRMDDPLADHPRISAFTIADGLSSNEILCLTEDRMGRIYAGTNRGVEQLEPGTGRVRHYTTADGLARGEVLAAACDGHGALWFVSGQEVSRFVPTVETSTASLPILISAIRIAGAPVRLSALGETAVAERTLGVNETSLSIEFVALGFRAGDRVRYQYRLENVAPAWSEPVEQRTVNYAGLSPGKYRFAVRAVNYAGVISDPPAAFPFTIPRPVWQRWWFLALLAAAVCGLAYTAYRYRVAQLVELERVRTRIASDLHDDIGANLTRISIFSEVAKQRLGDEDHNGLNPLTSIADLSRESVAAMSDIVWAINPKKDCLLDLVRRMRRQAEETLQARDIMLVFTAPSSAQDLKLGADVRRQVYLIFKEALNNIVCHADAGRVEIDFQIEGRWLSLRIIDDGAGFDPSREYEGNGLLSMQKRAISFQATLQIVSGCGKGTTVQLRAPLAPRNWLSLRK